MERTIEKVCIYVRKSREEETEDTINRQQSVLVSLCESNNWEYELYKEVGSSQDLDRPELQSMLEKVKLFLYDGIVIADLDRLSRNVVHFGAIKEIIINAGCFVITPTRTYDFSKNEDDFVSDIFSVISKQEYQTIKRRLVRGMRQSAKDGNYVGKKVPVGYKYNRETKRLELSEDAPIIRRLFEEYANGLSTKEIAYKFSFENVITSTGIIWTPAGVSRLLGNEIYNGHSIYGKTKRKGTKTIKGDPEDLIVVENTHEPIVDDELWNTVQQLKSERNSKPIALKFGKHTFSGLIRCGLCGNIHSFQTSRYKRKRICSCQTRHYNETMDKYTVCKNESCNLIDFENEFYPEFEKYANEFKNYVDMIKKSENKKSNNHDNTIQSKERQIKKLQQDIKRVQQGFIMEIFSESEAHEQITKYKQQVSVLENEIEELNQEDNDVNLDYLDKVITKMNLFVSGKGNLPEREANEILKEFIETILYEKSDETDHKIKMKIGWKDLV